MMLEERRGKARRGEESIGGGIKYLRIRSEEYELCEHLSYQLLMG